MFASEEQRGREPKTNYVVVAALKSGDRDVRSCGSMTEAILFSFEVEVACASGLRECPPMRVEIRAEVS